jgi:hypothetical protein
MPVPSLTLSHLRLTIVPEQTLHLPAQNKGNSLRGGFGTAFRRLVCVDMSWECATCTLRYQCPYTQVFNPFIPPDAPQFTGNQNIPRPFVFKPPLTEQTAYRPDEPLVFDLVLVGEAIDYLPYFIVAFRELGASGFGLNRVRVRLERVEAVAADGTLGRVYEADTNVVRPPAPMELPVANTLTPTLSRSEREFDPAPSQGEGELHSLPRSERELDLALQFLTPTALKAGSGVGREGEMVRRPAFHHVLKRLRDRVNALATFYGGGPLDLDFKALGEAAERIETARDDTHWVDRERFSGRRGVRHDLSGFAGTLTVRGDLDPFLPLLRLGEYVHVGKNAVFGNGWYEVCSPQSTVDSRQSPVDSRRSTVASRQ